MAVEVKGRGIRPVWAGGAWRMIDGGRVVMVDARSGELYRGAEGRKLEPVDSESNAHGELWDGGFEPKSIHALMGRSEHPYWWPRTYQDEDRRYVYNRRLLTQRIEEERIKSSRKASSLVATGVASAAIGNWNAAADDLSKAVEAEPENKDIRFYRGLILMALRDLDRAASDFAALADEGKRVASALDHLEILRGRKSADGLAAFMHNIETGIGWIPIDFRIGAEFLSRD
jgi:tetratricopeptide (TPR) repeat protein